jgi:hypothetical protein
MRRRAMYLCERCLAEQRLTLLELILATSTGPLRCTVSACDGRAYLADTPDLQHFMRTRDRSQPIPGRVR